MAATFILKRRIADEAAVAPPPDLCFRMDWGQEIKRIRKSQGLSQRGLARLAGVNRSSLRRFEANSAGGGTLSLIEQLADAMGYELDLLFRGFDRGGLRAGPDTK